MLATELIAKLQEVIDKYGDAPIIVDASDLAFYRRVIDVEGLYYTSNYYENGKPAQNIFIIINREE